MAQDDPVSIGPIQRLKAQHSCTVIHPPRSESPEFLATI